MRIEEGAIEINSETFQPLLPITIYLSLEAIQGECASNGLDVESELGNRIGTEVVNYLKSRSSRTA